MAVSSKLTQLPVASAVNSNTIFYAVLDPLGTPNSVALAFKTVFEANLTSNVVANGSLVISGKAISNVVQISYSTTPANSTAVPVGFANNTMWADTGYLYIITGPTTIKRIALTTF